MKIREKIATMLFGLSVLAAIPAFAAEETAGQARSSESTETLPIPSKTGKNLDVHEHDVSVEGNSRRSKTLDRCGHFSLALSGGGARGAAHVGVLKVLEREGLKPSFVCGTSIGALIGGLYASGVPVSKIEELVLTGELGKAFFPVSKSLQVIKYGIPYIAARSILLKPQIGLYSGVSLAKFVERNLPNGITRIEEMPIRFACCAVDVTTAKQVWMSTGNIGEAIRASNTYPGLFRPMRLGEHVLIDGGIRSNLPTGLAEAKGPSTVVAVRLQAHLQRVNPKEFDTVLDYGERISSIMLSESEDKELGNADILIEPALPWMRMNSYHEKELRAAIKAGEDAANKMLPQLMCPD